MSSRLKSPLPLLAVLVLGLHQLLMGPLLMDLQPRLELRQFACRMHRPTHDR